MGINESETQDGGSRMGIPPSLNALPQGIPSQASPDPPSWQSLGTIIPFFILDLIYSSSLKRCMEDAQNDIVLAVKLFYKIHESKAARLYLVEKILRELEQ